MPLAPRSLESARVRLSSVRMGSSSSQPSRLQVPQDKKAAPGCGAGSAATAHWVSCPAAAMTLAPLYSPNTVPLGTIGANRLSGTEKASNTVLLQHPVRASSIWLVEAMVVSQARTPHRA